MDKETGSTNSKDEEPQAVVDPETALELLEAAPSPARRLRARVFEIGLLAFALGFAILAVLAYNTPYLGIDLTITRLAQSFDPPWLVVTMQFVSWFGYALQSIAIVLASMLLLYRLGFAWEAFSVGWGAGFVFLLNSTIKLLIHRPRPTADLVLILRDVQGFSFPSGHVMFYMGFFGFLLFLAFTLLKKSWKRSILLAFFTGLLVLVGPSRVYLGGHWASDVLGAYLLGALGLWAIIRFYRWGKNKPFWQS